MFSAHQLRYNSMVRKTSKTEDGFKCKRHNGAISQVPFFKLRHILEYKTPLNGKRVETVSPTWASRMDFRTNKRDGKQQGCRYYTSDGIVLDADWNASINIVQRAKHLTSMEVPKDGN